MYKYITDLRADEVGKIYELRAKIEQIQQTSGPTLFTLFDGTGSIVAKTFAGPGVRAHPNLKEGFFIRAMVKLLIYDEALGAEMQSYATMSKQESDKLSLEIEHSLKKKAAPEKETLLVKSEILERLKPRMVAFATEVRRAIMESRPIILRHNADTDGYSAALALEIAIITQLAKHHDDEKAQWHYYKRYPSKSPSYEYTDALKDLGTTLQDMARFGMKEPLIILADFGGTRDEILGLKKIRAFGAKLIIVDHHYPGEQICGKTELEQNSDVFVNPHCVGGDGNICTGMLAAEIAHLIDSKCYYPLLGAVAAIGDKVKGTEADQFLAKANELGYDTEFLHKLAECIDFDAHYLKFIESRGLVNEMLLSERERQNALVDMLYDEIIKRRDAILEVVKHYVETKEYNKFLFGLIDIGATTVRGEYPSAGKSTGILFDYLKQNSNKPVIIFGCLSDAITIRSSSPEFNVNDFVHDLQKIFPHALVEGGGHDVAGSVRFIEKAQPEIMAYAKEWMEQKGN